MAETIMMVCKCVGAISFTLLVVLFCLTGAVGLIKLLARMADMDIDTPKEQGWKESWSGKDKK